VAAASPGLLWRVTAGARVSYLFGTIHLPLPLDRALGAPGRAAFASSRVLYVEMDLRDAQHSRALAASALRAGVLPPGESLRRMLPPPLWAELQRLLPRTPPHALDRLQPWLATLSTIQAIAAQSGAAPPAQGTLRDPPMDAALVGEARGRRLPVRELDSMEQQLEAFTAMPRTEALAALRELLEAPDAAAGELRTIVDSYESADAEARLAAVVAQMERRTPTFTEYLLHRRTARWAETLGPSLAAGGSFVAVGAGHLVGPQGLPALLARRGFRVERVR
jgi:hypothetical protein